MIWQNLRIVLEAIMLIITIVFSNNFFWNNIINTLKYTKIYYNDNYNRFYHDLWTNLWIQNICFIKNFADNDSVENFNGENKILIFLGDDVTKNYCNKPTDNTIFHDSDWNLLLTWKKFETFLLTKNSKFKDGESDIEKIKKHYSFRN